MEEGVVVAVAEGIQKGSMNAESVYHSYTDRIGASNVSKHDSRANLKLTLGE